MPSTAVTANDLTAYMVTSMLAAGLSKAALPTNWVGRLASTHLASIR